MLKLISKTANKLPLPTSCYGCQNLIINKSASYSLCQDCYDNLPRFNDSTCSFCFHEHPSNQCLETDEWRLDELRSIFHYHKPVSRWLLSFKYNHNLLVGRILQDLFYRYWQLNAHLFEEYDFIIPMPRHKKFNLRPKLNAIFYIVKGIKLAKLRIDKIKHTKSLPRQATLNKAQREKNMSKRGIFKVDKTLSGKSILLLDDVCTTGATIRNLARELRINKVKKVGALVFMREGWNRLQR
ncbi:MAG: ComF family protein [SAR324 cluster bacterium]|nr:ComF family protein [SAR324 cluster bacterium]